MAKVIRIMQGDAVELPLQVKLDGTAAATTDIQAVEVMIGSGLRKMYPGEITADTGAEGTFRVPVTQEETFALPAGGGLAVNARVKFAGGAVLGAETDTVLEIVNAISGKEI